MRSYAHKVHLLLISLRLVGVLALAPTPRTLRLNQIQIHPAATLWRLPTTLHAKNDKDDLEYWLGEFSTSTGEVIQPYKVLGGTSSCRGEICGVESKVNSRTALAVSREATTEEIKRAYRSLSRKYHPDGMRFRTILPGSCNNLEEVRDHWERIKLSYEILSRPKMRKRYDRKEFMADPAAAVQRAAVDAAVRGAVNVGKGIGKGLFKAGTFAFNQLTKKPESKSKSAQEGTRPAGDMNKDATNVDADVVLLTSDSEDATELSGGPRKAKARRRKSGRGFAKNDISE